MKLKITLQSGGKPFPKIMEHKSYEFQVFFTSPTEGVVCKVGRLSSIPPSLQITYGLHRNDWNSTRFKDIDPTKIEDNGEYPKLRICRDLKMIVFFTNPTSGYQLTNDHGNLTEAPKHTSGWKSSAFEDITDISIEEVPNKSNTSEDNKFGPFGGHPLMEDTE